MGSGEKMRVRMVHKLLPVCVFLAACHTGHANVLSSASWPMYQYAPSHNAVFPRHGFRTHWKFTAEGKINGSLAILNDVLYVDSFGKDVIALDVRTGRPIWRAHTDNIVMTTPVVGHGLVYVGSGMHGTLTDPGTVQLPFTTYDVLGRAQGDKVTAFDAQTGKQVWSFKTVGEDMPSAALVNDTLIFANGDSHAYGIDAKSGRLRWVRTLGGPAAMASANFLGSTIFVSTCVDRLPDKACQTDALDSRTGRIIWRAPYGNWDCSPTYGDGAVFCSSSRFAPGTSPITHYTVADVTALDAHSGRLRWIYHTPNRGMYSSVGSDEGSIAGTYADGTYYQPICTHDRLMAFDARTGKIRWSFTSLAPIKMSPVIAGGMLIAGDTSGILYSLNARTGKMIRSLDFAEPFTTSPPVVVGDTVFVAGSTTVYAIPLNKLRYENISERVKPAPAAPHIVSIPNHKVKGRAKEPCGAPAPCDSRLNGTS